MARKPLIAGNWKMNGTPAGIKQLLQGLLQHRHDFDHVQVAVFPPFVFLPLVQEYLNGSPIAWGGQNVSDKLSGAYTGEISAPMLHEFHCQYVIVGHSERRILYKESNELIGAKFAVALSQGLRPILCVGETEQQRQEGVTLDIVKEQLAVAFKLVDNLEQLAQSIIAYEPVWAIGTGQNATPEQAQEVHLAIRGELARRDDHLASTVNILYGGSVKPENAQALFAMPDIDGALVGGASLDMKQFVEIAQQCKY